MRYDYFYLHSGTLEKRHLKNSVTRKRLPSRITRNGLLSKDPLVYDKSLMLWERNSEPVDYIIFIFSVFHRDGSKC